MYDPQMDDDDERWVGEQRNKHLPPGARCDGINGAQG